MSVRIVSTVSTPGLERERKMIAVAPAKRATRLVGLAAGAALLLPGCGKTNLETVPELVLGPSEHVSSIPAHDPLGQAVAVVFLAPETTLTVDVISGRLYLPPREHIIAGGPNEHEGLIGLMDPQLHNQFFRYADNGIAGEPGWDPRWGDAPAPAPGRLPVWVPPRLITHRGRPTAVVLADGQRVNLNADQAGRITSLHWQTPRGEPLLTTIRYAAGATTVSGPAGVVRTYRYDARDLINEVETPEAGAYAHSDAADGRLDSQATAHLLEPRLQSGTQERYAAYEAAPNAISENYVDLPTTDGYLRYGVPTLNDMRRVDAALRRSGALDIAEAIPVINNLIETSDENDFDRTSEGLLRPCHSQTGSDNSLTIDHAISPRELAAVASRMRRLHRRWIYIYYASPEVGCAYAVPE